jgi:hypothetical protein
MIEVYTIQQITKQGTAVQKDLGDGNIEETITQIDGTSSLVYTHIISADVLQKQVDIETAQAEALQKSIDDKKAVLSTITTKPPIKIQ